MDSININFAYDGFLYAPLFLAEELGVFQKRTFLKYRQGDEATIDSLAVPRDPQNGSYNWFAVCDPFAKDITGIQASLGKRDDVCIVAVLVRKLPVWLCYSGGAKFEPVANLDALGDRKQSIEYLRCYKRNNTGYLIGEMLRRKLGHLSEDKLYECEFGEEFDKCPEKTLVVTSDILRLIKDGHIDSGRIAFSYGGRAPKELDPFLFTAVLTLKSVVDQHLDAVLSVLSGLGLAIREISKPGSLQSLTNRFSGFTAAEIHRAVGVLTDEEIYSSDFELEEAATAYENARAAWKTVKPIIQFAEIEKCREPIPCLLLKYGWNTDKTLVDLLVKRWKTDPRLVEILTKELPERPVNPLKNKYHILLAVMLAILAVAGGLLLVNGWKRVTPANIGYWLICAFILLIQLICTVMLAWNVVRKFEMKGFEFLAGTILAMFGLLLSTVIWIVK